MRIELLPTLQRKHRALHLLTVTLCLLAFLVPDVRSQVPPPDGRFGAVEAFRDPVAAAEAGVGWERILFYWSELQPGGPDDWNGYHVPDDWLNQALAAGREVVGLLKHTPAWATDGPIGCGVPRGLSLPTDDPGNLWAGFVRRTVQVYSGRIRHWIIWNEPDIAPETYGAEWCGSIEDYYRLLQVAYLVAHEVDPDVTIHLAGSTFYHDRTWLRRFLTVATQDPSGQEHGYYFDVFSLHIYFQTEQVPYIVDDARAAMNDYGVHKPIWINETNASPDSDPLWPMVRPCFQVTLDEQAGFLLQSFALALASGVERVAVYKWLDNDLPPGGEPFGVLRPDYSRRPAYEAFRLITSHYAGTTAARAVREPLFYQVTLERGDRTTRVFWARTATTTTVSVPALAPEGLLVAQSGETQVVQPADGIYTLTLPHARCPVEHPECWTTHPPCIIGGQTLLLVESGTGDPGRPAEAEPPQEAQPTETAPQPELGAQDPVTPTAAPSPTPAPTATPTATPSPSPSPSPSPTPPPTPTATPVPPPPTATLAPTPAPPTPTPPAERDVRAPALLALTVLLTALLIVTVVRRR